MRGSALAYRFTVPEDEARFAFDVAAHEKSRFLNIAGEETLREIGEGNRATVMFRWQRRLDYTVRAIEHHLTVDICPVDRREIAWIEPPEMRTVLWQPRRTLPGRIGHFFADKWREAGETVQGCKA